MKVTQMKKHSTFNIQRPTSKDAGGSHWMLAVGCWLLNVSRFRLVGGALLLMAGATPTFAQSNGAPGPTDYAKFSAFVTDRNIFDPNRQPHSYVPGYHPKPRPRTRTEAPDIMLVGTMSYEKGMFAFFNGNSADLKKAMRVGEKIADYTRVRTSPPAG